MRHELPAVRIAASHVYRIPLGAGRLRPTLREIRPDVVLLRDPISAPGTTGRVATEVGALSVFVHHAGVERDAATIVLCVGRLSREKGVDVLLEAAARTREPWPLTIVGSGPRSDALAGRVRRLGLSMRVSFRPFVDDRERLARLYARALVVCLPGCHETFGLVALEAAASGARTVTDASTPSARVMGSALVETYPGGDAGALLAARPSWPAVFTAELADLQRLTA